jgi:hypothetical protein
MDKSRIYLFLAERVTSKVTLNQIYQRFEELYSQDELENAFDELSSDKVLKFVNNPYPSTFCDICGDEVSLESNELGYSGFHTCEKIDKTIDEIDEYEVIEDELLKAISNDFGYNVVSVDQAKIKLRQYLKEGELYEFYYDKIKGVLIVNGMSVPFKHNHAIGEYVKALSYFYKKGIYRIDMYDFMKKLGEHFGNDKRRYKKLISTKLGQITTKIKANTGISLTFRTEEEHILLV